MSHKNYTRYSKMNNEESALVDDACSLNGCGVDENENAYKEQPIEGQTTIPEVESEPAVMATAVEPEPIIEPDIRKIGRVYGCQKLNVRKLPNPGAEILTEVVEGSEVMIDEDSSTAVFYKVCTECGIEGYCMKKFIKVLL